MVFPLQTRWIANPKSPCVIGTRNTSLTKAKGQNQKENPQEPGRATGPWGHPRMRHMQRAPMLSLSPGFLVPPSVGSMQIQLRSSDSRSSPRSTSERRKLGRRLRDHLVRQLDHWQHSGVCRGGSHFEQAVMYGTYVFCSGFADCIRRWHTQRLHFRGSHRRRSATLA